MSELVEYQNNKYKRSLSSLEKHFINELHGIRINTLNSVEWRQLIAKACITNSIKDLPSDLEVELLLQSFQSGKFINVTPESFNIAFYLNAMGTEWERIEHYNCFSVAYMCDVLNKYLELKNKTWVEINKAIKPCDTIPKTVHDVNLEDWLENDIKKYAEGKWQFIEVYAANIAREMFSKQLFTSEDFTSDQWNNWRKTAESKVQMKWKTKGKKREFAEEDFTFDINQEVGRIVYEYILKNKLKTK
jgi:hypothetical protein